MVRRARQEESMELSSIGESVYAAEAVLKKRTVNDQEEYLIKWKGWSVKYSTWEPKENILDERLFEAFERQQQLEEEPKKKRRRRRKLQASQSIAPFDDVFPVQVPVETHDQCTGTDTPPPETQDRVPVLEEHGQSYDTSNGEVSYETESLVSCRPTVPPAHEICYELASVVENSKNKNHKKKKEKLTIVETKPKAKRGRPKLLIKFVNKKIKEVKRKKEESPVPFKKKKKLHWKQRAKLEAQLQASLLAAAELSKKESSGSSSQAGAVPAYHVEKFIAPSAIPSKSPPVIPEVIPKPVRKRGRPRKYPLKTPPVPIVPPTPPVEQPVSPVNTQKQRRFPDYKLMAEKRARDNKRNLMSIWRPSNELLNSVLVTDVSVGGLMVTIKENVR